MNETMQPAATLAAAVIRNMNRPVSLDEVNRIFKDMLYTLNPGNSGAYQKWERETPRDEPYK